MKKFKIYILEQINIVLNAKTNFYKILIAIFSYNSSIRIIGYHHFT